MEFKPANDRGFLRGEFDDAYGTKCSLQESSNAEQRCIWFGVNEAEVKQFVPNGPSVDGKPSWRAVELPEGTHISSRMHLNQDQVQELLPALEYFVEHGVLPS